MKQTFSDLRTKGIIINLGSEKFIIRKATERELAEHGLLEDKEQVTMTVENNAFTVPAHRMGD